MEDLILNYTRYIYITLGLISFIVIISIIILIIFYKKRKREKTLLESNLIINKIKCKYCNNDIDIDSKYCKYCGKSI